MFEAIDLSTATARHWDAIIVGSSFSAMFFLRGLPRELNVLVVEKGGISDHASILENGIPGGERVAQRNTSAYRKVWVVRSTFGGNSNCWWGCTPRFHPADFEMQTRYGVGADWPFGYHDLEPYYHEAEVLLDVAGGGSDHILPRSAPFPFPPHLPSRSDRLMRRTSRDWFAQPTARSNGGRRAVCCANGICGTCPIDAKFTVLNSVDLFARPNAYLLTDADARAVHVEAGKVTGLDVRALGKDHALKGNLVALGANALYNAAILMRSDIHAANLGRGINEQLARKVFIDAPGMGPFGGTSYTGHGYPLYDGPHRARHSGILIEIANTPGSYRAEKDRWFERTLFKLIAEDLPQEANRVILEDDEPVVTWTGHHRYATEALDWGVQELANMIEGREAVRVLGDTVTESHILGTHRMGPDSGLDVLDGFHRCHEVPTLFALGSGAFPTTSPANPSLTIAACALRAAREGI